MDPNTKRFLLIERNVLGALSACKKIYDKETNSANCRGHIHGKSDTASRRASGRFFRNYPGRWHCSPRRPQLLPFSALEDLPVGQDVGVGDSDVDDPDRV